MDIFGGRKDVIDDHQMDLSPSRFDSMETVELGNQRVGISFYMLLSAHVFSGCGLRSIVGESFGGIYVRRGVKSL